MQLEEKKQLAKKLAGIEQVDSEPTSSGNYFDRVFKPEPPETIHE